MSTQPQRPVHTVSELTRRNVRAMRKLEDLARTHRTFADRMAEAVATFCGSIVFVWAHVVIFGLWIAWNAWPGLPHFDPFPFTFLTLCVSLEAIFLSSFILIAQNYEMRISERRAQLDLQVNMLAEQENTKTLRLLEAIARKLEIPVDDDPEMHQLEGMVDPAHLARQIDEALRERSRQPRRKPRY